VKDINTVKKLIKLISEDDSSAFAKFYDLFYSKAIGFSHYFVKSNDACGEIVSDVFYYLWQNRKNLAKVQNIDGYLYTSIKNQSLKYIKQAQRFPQDSIDDLPVEVFIETESPEKILISAELKIILDKAINELPEKCKIIFLLVREEGLKYKEVAEILSISDRTVHAQIVIATKKIIHSIQQYYPTITPDKTFLLFLMYLKKYG
jgi:RNA polymerase sigma-70 factor (family 1)